MTESRSMDARSAAVLAVALTAAACGSGADSAPQVGSITEADLRADLFTLSHDSMSGRLVGTPEIDAASDWIRDRFESLGLEPAGDAANLKTLARCRGYDADFQRTILIRTKLDKWYPDLSPSNINDWASFFL